MMLANPDSHAGQGEKLVMPTLPLAQKLLSRSCFPKEVKNSPYKVMIYKRKRSFLPRRSCQYDLGREAAVGGTLKRSEWTTVSGCREAGLCFSTQSDQRKDERGHILGQALSRAHRTHT